MVDWREYITTNEEILMGKPHIKETRLSVEFILERLASGWSEQDIFENYPRLNQDSLKAIFSYTYECMRDGLLFLPTEKRA